MNMKDVKAITIPEGTVKKIEDANGNIIWGSQSAFPYRRLEYIHFNGTDNWVQTIGIGCVSNGTRYYTITFSIDGAPTPMHSVILGKYDSAGAAIANRRFYLPEVDPTKGARFGCGDKFSSYFSLSNNTKYKTSANLVNAKTLNYSLTDLSNNSTVISGQLVSSGTLANNVSLGVMGMADHTGYINANSSPQAGKVYEVTYSNSSASVSYHYLIPVQRKSDGAIGFYDPVVASSSEKWIPLLGTVDANTMGPVVDEYWDLQV